MTARPSSPVCLDQDQAWQVITAERLRLADLLGQLTPGEWDQPSLCEGWAVRDVAAHLTLQQLGPRDAARLMIRYRGDADRAIFESARGRAADWPAGAILTEIRGTAGSRRHNFGVTYRETLIDILIHTQDIAIALGRDHAMPPEAAAMAATRVWTMRWPPPFPARRVMSRFRVTATDIAWTAGQGPGVRGPVSAILLLSAGRLAALPSLSGEGAAELGRRLSS